VKELIKDVEIMVVHEYFRAAAMFGKANNSNHESFAVILEELEEADDKRFEFKGEFERFWSDVKKNTKNVSALGNMQKLAVQTACEWVQVAAMCHKAMQNREG